MRPESVIIREVGPREGLQLEPTPVKTSRKIEWINRLASTGLPSVEAVSFVNPKRVPQMADAEQVARGISAPAGVAFEALYLNRRGLEQVLAHPVFRVRGNIAFSASEEFGVRNTGRTHAESLEEAARWIDVYEEHGIPVNRVAVMAAFGCNFQGAVSMDEILEVLVSGIELLESRGHRLDTIQLADTMGWATPDGVRAAVSAVLERWPDTTLSLHLHDTRGLGLANATAALDLGVQRFDSSVAGIGGCPFAGDPMAAGNIATEELVFLCDELGIDTGVDLEALVEVARETESMLGRRLPSKLIHTARLSLTP